MNDLVISHSYLAEVDTVTATAFGTKVYFKDVPTLQPRDNRTVILFMGVEAYDANDLTNTPNQLPTIPAAQIPTCSLTLAVGSKEYLWQMPLFNLQPKNNGGFIRRLNALRVNLTKSFVNFNGVVAANIGIPFNFYFVIQKFKVNLKR